MDENLVGNASGAQSLWGLDLSQQAQHVCPACGYCPCCGRKNAVPVPSYPPWPGYPSPNIWDPSPYPWTVTCSNY